MSLIFHCILSLLFRNSFFWNSTKIYLSMFVYYWSKICSSKAVASWFVCRLEFWVVPFSCVYCAKMNWRFTGRPEAQTWEKTDLLKEQTRRKNWTARTKSLFILKVDEIGIKMMIVNLQSFLHGTFRHIYGFLCSLVYNKNVFLWN